jgi:hypothetical protein
VLGSACTAWNPEQTVATTYNVAGFSAAVMSSKIVLAYRASDPAGTNTNLIYVKSSNTIDAVGNVSAWSAEASRGVRTAFEPELDLFTINAGTFGTTPTQVLALFYRNAANSEFRWQTATGPTGTWTDRGAMRDQNGQVLTGAMSPTIAARGSGTTAEYCGLFPDTGSALGFYCFDRPNVRWRLVTALDVATSKPGLAFHTRRKADGNPLSAVKDGQWYLAYVPASQVPTMRVSTLIASANNTTFPTWSSSSIANQWDRQLAGAGIVLFEDDTVGSLKGVRIYDVGNSNPRIEFMPFMDGTVSVQLKDGNDWRVMARAICEKLRGSSFCGAADPITGY